MKTNEKTLKLRRIVAAAFLVSGLTFLAVAVMSIPALIATPVLSNIIPAAISFTVGMAISLSSIHDIKTANEELSILEGKTPKENSSEKRRKEQVINEPVPAT